MNPGDLNLKLLSRYTRQLCTFFRFPLHLAVGKRECSGHVLYAAVIRQKAVDPCHTQGNSLDDGHDRIAAAG